MSVIRVKKNKNYTTMSNYHLKDKNLSLKAKGLLSMILSLPDSWHYSVRGLSSICKEGKDSIAKTLRELEKCGYVYRQQARDAGRFVQIEYIVFEDPKFNTYLCSAETNTSSSAGSHTDNPCAESPCTESPCPENPYTVNADAYKILIQSITKESNTDVINHLPNQSDKTDEVPDLRLIDLAKHFVQVFNDHPSEKLGTAMRDALAAGLTYGTMKQAIDNAAARNPDHPSAYTAALVQDYIQRGGAPMLSLANQKRHPDDPLTQCEKDWLEEFYAMNKK